VLIVPIEPGTAKGEKGGALLGVRDAGKLRKFGLSVGFGTYREFDIVIVEEIEIIEGFLAINAVGGCDLFCFFMD
jgi:hypothetical protein